MIAPAEHAGPRTARAAAFTAAMVLLALGAHRLMGGQLPGPTVSAPLFLLTGALGWWTSARERRGPLLGVLVVGGQLAWHAALALAPLLPWTARPSSPTTGQWAALLFCHHGAHDLTPDQIAAATRGITMPSGLAPSTGPALLDGLTDPMALGMLAAHLAAAAVLAWWLRIGERRCFAAVARVLDSCRRGWVSPVLPPRPPVPVATPRPPFSRSIRPASGRGPPHRPAGSLRTA